MEPPGQAVDDCRPAAPLREFNKRLVCDKCEGMMLAIDDYAGSLRDIDLSASVLVVSDTKAETAKCPRCDQAMQSCLLVYGDRKLKERYLVCERDGVWVSSDNMLAAYARVSRAAAPRCERTRVGRRARWSMSRPAAVRCATFATRSARASCGTARTARGRACTASSSARCAART